MLNRFIYKNYFPFNSHWCLGYRFSETKMGEETSYLLCFPAILSKACVILLFPAGKEKEEKIYIRALLKNSCWIAILVNYIGYGSNWNSSLLWLLDVFWVFSPSVNVLIDIVNNYNIELCFTFEHWNCECTMCSCVHMHMKVLHAMSLWNSDSS